MARSGRPPKVDPLKPIHKAVMTNDIDGFSVELAAGNDINSPGPEGMTPLHIAADKGNFEFVKALLDVGVDIDPINVWGNTPLWMAIMSQHLNDPDGAIIRLLIDHGADPARSEQPKGNTPLVMIRRIAGFPEDLIELIEGATKKQ
ncbi:ankyrin repeat domain-containing protein [Mycolicibacterium komossense]|uniref:Ankyrin repeat domain-containing protein n=1 Tax=Mycolicibacterium komossense TaxID=1779 RepID=A0ABT3C5C3_9MYCO|nr:ankyrin repeat domain-containing protein [Mycolicibacterium komossense]MCV7224660.1 ankyrin repeat domain-containing protein [Mycolicibacterium komossense]